MKFHKNLLQTHKNLGTQTYKEKFAGGSFFSWCTNVAIDKSSSKDYFFGSMNE